MSSYLLGIDNGGTVAKAALFGLDGREIAVAGRKTGMASPHPGHTERDMDQLWQSTAEAIREVLQQSRIDPGQIACIAGAGHGNGLYLVDQSGRPVRPGIVSTDSRAKDYVRRWQQDGTARRVLPETMQSLWPGQPVALLAWLRDREPESLRRAGWVLMCKDYIRFRLCGKIDAERTDMSGTHLLSVRSGQYQRSLLEAFGLEGLESMLPPVRASEEICGTVTAKAAAETGLRAGTPVAAGLFDIDACALACGLLDENPFSMIAGTWSINQYVSSQPVVHEDLFMCSRYCLPGRYLVPEASATSASNLEWFVQQWLSPAASQAASAPSPTSASPYDLANQLVAATRPEDSDVLFLPFLFGSNADADAKACFLGMAGWHERGHVLRAIYEGVVFGHKAHYDRLLKFRRPPRTIRLTGGAARSGPWVQLFADVFQVPIELPAGSELGALGAAVCAGVAAGCFADYAQGVAAMVAIRQTVEPDPGKAEIYARKYQRYLRTIEALSPLWRDSGHD